MHYKLRCPSIAEAMMPAFGARRKPRKVGQEEGDSTSGDTALGDLSSNEQGKYGCEDWKCHFLTGFFI